MNFKISDPGWSPPRCPKCSSFVRPSVHLDQDLFPQCLYRQISEDLPRAGMVIVLGSDLSRQPQQAMVKRVPMVTPVVVVGEEDPPGTSILLVLAWPRPSCIMASFPADVFLADGRSRLRLRGCCDPASMALVDALGWADGFEAFATFSTAGVRRSRSTRRFKK